MSDLVRHLFTLSSPTTRGTNPTSSLLHLDEAVMETAVCRRGWRHCGQAWPTSAPPTQLHASRPDANRARHGMGASTLPQIAGGIAALTSSPTRGSTGAGNVRRRAHGR